MTRARTAHCADHARHVGVCPACQRARLEAEKRQLAEVREVLDTDGQRARAVVSPPGEALPAPGSDQGPSRSVSGPSVSDSGPSTPAHGPLQAGVHGFTSAA